MSAWTDERVAELKKLWGEGHSASQIAGRLNRLPGPSKVSRNAVVGKVHRLGLAERLTPSRPVTRPKKLAMPRPAPVMERDTPAEHDRDDRDLDVLTWIARDKLPAKEIAAALDMKPAEVSALWRTRQAQEATGEAA